MVGNSDESGWRRPPARRGISRSPPYPVDSFRTAGGGFWYRISLPYRRSLFFTPNASENASRTGGSLFEHGTHIPYPSKPSRYRMPTTQPPNHLATTAHPALRYRMPQSQKWEMHCLQRIYQTAGKEEAIAKAQSGMPPKSFLTENPGLTLSLTRKPQMSSLPQKCSRHHP